MNIAIQGEIGSFHHQATTVLFADDNYSILPCESFRKVFQAVEEGSADFGVVAVENSLYGSLHETYDQLVKTKFSIVGEVSLQIHQNLIAQPNTDLSQITEVLSHPAALDQCRNFLDTQLPNARLIERADTAGAVAEIAATKLPHQAAIASHHASNLHHMSVISENIEDEPDNITRFIVISPRPQTIQHANKASLILTTSHQPGALHQALGVFEQNHANLTKLESRPVRGQPFRYQFIIDVHTDQSTLIALVHELEQLDCSVEVLGHYKITPATPDIA